MNISQRRMVGSEGMVGNPEFIVPKYSCSHSNCAFSIQWVITDGATDGHWVTSKGEAFAGFPGICGEVHIDGRLHWLDPDDIPGLAIECSEEECDQTGCNLSDCLFYTQKEGKCPVCDAPARIYVLPPEKGGIDSKECGVWPRGRW